MVEVEGGAVTLRGIVVDDREKALAAEVVGAIGGVQSVDNQLRTMAGGLRIFPTQSKYE